MSIWTQICAVTRKRSSHGDSSHFAVAVHHGTCWDRVVAVSRGQLLACFLWREVLQTVHEIVHLTLFLGPLNRHGPLIQCSSCLGQTATSGRIAMPFAQNADDSYPTAAVFLSFQSSQSPQCLGQRRCHCLARADIEKEGMPTAAFAKIPKWQNGGLEK